MSAFDKTTGGYNQQPIKPYVSVLKKCSRIGQSDNQSRLTTLIPAATPCIFCVHFSSSIVGPAGIGLHRGLSSAHLWRHNSRDGECIKPVRQASVLALRLAPELPAALCHQAEVRSLRSSIAERHCAMTAPLLYLSQMGRWVTAATTGTLLVFQQENLK